MTRVLLVLSVTRASEATRRGPRKDYVALTAALQATVIDRSSVEESRMGRLVRRVGGVAVAQAYLAFRRRRGFDAIVTDGEHIGVPLALMLKAARDDRPHVTIGHRISAAKKRPFFRQLKVHTHISRIALHSRHQYELALSKLRIPANRLSVIPYQVDTQFWRPRACPEERLVCSAGLEFRDYPTLVQAVDGLDVKVVIGAASHWSKRNNTASTTHIPANVMVDRFDYFGLRDLYARASIVVVPLDDVDFQAGITTILEAMAMAKPVIVTHSIGQTDAVEDRRTITRGRIPRTRPESLIRRFAEVAGVAVEPTGFYVPPNEPDALRRAIIYLLDHPEERARLGAAGRRTVEQLASLEHYVSRLSAIVEEAVADVGRSVAWEPTNRLELDSSTLR